MAEIVCRKISAADSARPFAHLVRAVRCVEHDTVERCTSELFEDADGHITDRDDVVSRWGDEVPSFPPGCGRLVYVFTDRLGDVWMSIGDVDRELLSGCLSDDSFCLMTFGDCISKGAVNVRDLQETLSIGEYFRSLAVSPAPRERGHVYVIEFSTGIVKVGSSARVSRRLEEHARDAAKQGAKVVRKWISSEHAEFRQNERRLIAGCSSKSIAVVGREYFSMSFDDAVRIASQLDVADRSVDELSAVPGEGAVRLFERTRIGARARSRKVALWEAA